ncbi:MAG: Holliday junction branch migration protein RuvA [Neisseriaceae bacterium]|nr:Holliday junction branch migration protein RuvA [Neisseriaceae bacterium]
MITRLSGILLEKHPSYTVIDVSGIGYCVHISVQTFDTLPEINQSVVLHIQMIVREDALLLFGFSSVEERESFRHLIRVSGIGAKMALSALSVFDSKTLANAIANEDVRRLSSIPGIGKKTAERMILELRGQLVHLASDTSQVAKSRTIDDVIATLISLGYNEREATLATKELPENVDIGEGVRLALKKLAK